MKPRSHGLAPMPGLGKHGGLLGVTPLTGEARNAGLPSLASLLGVAPLLSCLTASLGLFVSQCVGWVRPLLPRVAPRDRGRAVRGCLLSRNEACQTIRAGSYQKGFCG